MPFQTTPINLQSQGIGIPLTELGLYGREGDKYSYIVYFGLSSTFGNTLLSARTLKVAKAALEGPMAVIDMADTSGATAGSSLATFPHTLYYGSIPDPAATQAALWTNLPDGPIIGDTFSSVRGACADCEIIYVLRRIPIAFAQSAYTPWVVSRFSMKTDSWLSDITGVPIPTQTGGIPPGNQSVFGDGEYWKVAIAARERGELVVLHSGQFELVQGDSLRKCVRSYISVYRNGAWTGPTLVMGTGIYKDFLPAAAFFGSNGRVHCFLTTYDPAASADAVEDLYHVVVRQDGGFTAPRLIDTQMISYDAFNSVVMHTGITYRESGKLKMAAPCIRWYPETGREQIAVLLADEGEAPDWKIEQISTDLDIPSGSIFPLNIGVVYYGGSAAAGIVGSPLPFVITIVGGEMYAFWAEAEGTNLFGHKDEGRVVYSVRNPDGSWRIKKQFLDFPPPETLKLPISIATKLHPISDCASGFFPQYRKPFHPGA